MERVRFAKKEIARALTALERVDPDTFGDGMRVLELEDRVRELHNLAERWRISYEKTTDYIYAQGDPEAKKRDMEFREWIAKA